MGNGMTEKEQQAKMASNIGQLKGKEAKKHQAHFLCRSLIDMLKRAKEDASPFA